ncbi:MAG TPA: hypothetical protein VFF11_16895 [Candidatus Binatia bacterium]|nr:hypothetical protein [Candidatus Binatia bacterium]
MKRKSRNKRHSNRPPAKTSAWLDLDDNSDEDLVPFPEVEGADATIKPFSADYFLDVAINVEKAICDLPVWKDLVARVGLQKARKILRRGVFIDQITDGSPRN